MGGLLVSELTFIDPVKPDPDPSATDIKEFLWTYSPIPRIHITVSAPMLPAGEAATVPIEIGIVPMPRDGTHYTQAELDARYCRLGTVYLAGVTNVPTAHEIEQLPMIDDCFAAGLPILAGASPRYVPSDTVRTYTTYYVNLALQPRPFDPSAPETAVVPRTYFTAASDAAPMHPECTTTSDEPGRVGCVWDMAVWPVTTGAEVRPDALQTQSCVATVWTDPPLDGTFAQEPFARATMSVTAFGRATDPAGRTVLPELRPLVEYFVEPTRLSMPSGDADRGERLRVATHDDATLTDADTTIPLVDFVFNTSEPHDHVIYLTGAARDRILRGEWGADEMFTLSGCLAKDASTPPTDRDCKTLSILVDRAPPPSGVAIHDPGGAGGGGAACAPEPGWRFAPININEYRGDARLLQFQLQARSVHELGSSTLQSTNVLGVTATALGGVFRRTLVDAYANVCAVSTPSGATLNGEARVTAFGTDYLGPISFMNTYSFAAMPYGASITLRPSLSFIVYVVPVTITFSGSGMWGWQGGRINWGPAATADPAFAETGYDRVYELESTATPFANVSLSATATARVLVASASITGTVNLLSVALPTSARVQVGASSTRAGLAARFEATADRTITIGGGQVTAAWSAFGFPGRQTLFTLPPLSSRTDTLFRYSTPVGSTFETP